MQRQIPYINFIAILSLVLGCQFSARAEELGSNSKHKDPAEVAKLIDQEIDKKLKDAEMKPAGIIDKTTFIRRASLDIRGVAPSAKEVYDFVYGKEGDRRKLIKAWLQDPGYAEHWSDVWKRALIGRNTTARKFFGSLFAKWLEEQFQKNKAYDELVNDILTAEGTMMDNGASNYILRYETKAADIAANSARQFMGLQIECAQCHDHPYNDYKQEDFWGMAGFFGRTQLTRKRNPNRAGDGNKKGAKGSGKGKQKGRRKTPGMAKLQPKRIFGVKDRSSGVLKLDKNGDPVKPNDWGRSINPKFILKEFQGTPVANKFRQNYADFVTSPKNKFFSRMAVNRVWSILFGRGLVNPIEDLEQGDTLHPELHSKLAAEFVAADFDLKWLIESIILSRSYQRDSKRKSGQADYANKAKSARKIVSEERLEQLSELAAMERALFARAELRPLSPEQIFRSIVRSNDPNDDRQFRNKPGFRQLLRGVSRQFVQVFDNDVEGMVEEYSGTIPQSLLMMNGRFISSSLESKLGGLEAILRDFKDPKSRIQWIFMNFVSRPPSREEVRLYLRHVKKHKNARSAYEDVAWVLLNSSEFLFNS